MGGVPSAPLSSSIATASFNMPRVHDDARELPNFDKIKAKLAELK